MRKLAGILRSKPQLIDLAIIGAVSTHLLLYVLVPDFNYYLSPLTDSRKVDMVHNLYLGLLGPASIVAGLAGVVITFALSSSSERFKQLRADGGRPLQRTWISSSLSAMIAVAASIAASMLVILDKPAIATFAFEAALLFLLHGTARLLWILYKLIGVQRIDDRMESDEAKWFKLEHFPRQPRKSSQMDD